MNIQRSEFNAAATRNGGSTNQQYQHDGLLPYEPHGTHLTAKVNLARARRARRVKAASE